ncbi:MAG: PAS domain S-box protein [Sandaracinaceae bacterium]|nr:PAS domain S-box protein [Sandaracinaceae bacterium]
MPDHTTSTRVAEAIRLIHVATSKATGDEFFRALVRAMADVLGTRFAFAGEVTPGTREVVSVAMWNGEGFIDDFRYDLEHTPCAAVVGGDYCQYPTNVQRAFPRDTLLVDMGIEAYFGVPIRGRDGTPLGLLVALHDQPRAPVDDLDEILAHFAARAGAELERRAVEVALRESEARYREIVSTCAEGIWKIDAEGITTFVNPQMAAMLGYDPADMLGRPVFDFMDESGREQALVRMERRRAGLNELHRFDLLRCDGAVVHTLMNTNPVLDAAGGYQGALAMVTDVTHQVGLENRAREAQKLESLGLMAGGIAHDFNNLLVGILGRADLALARIPPTEPAHRIVEGIRDAASRAADLTNQLLVYAGRSPVKMQPVDLNRCVLEIAGLCASSAPSGARVEVAGVSQAKLMVLADPGALTQIVLNLITNGVQALGPAGGVVRVSAEPSEVSMGAVEAASGEALAAGRYAVLRVEDNGSGIDEATRARVFDPFFTTKSTGRGLGLAVVDGIVRSHGGAIVITSQRDHGSTFEVYLPLSAASDEVAVEVPTAARSTTAARALLADDEAVVREVVELALGDAGYEVDTCVDGAVALRLFEAAPQRYSIVLLDVTMPVLGGLEAARRMLMTRPEMPIVIMSGFTDERVPDELRHLRFMQKPFGIAALLDALEPAGRARR